MFHLYIFLCVDEAFPFCIIETVSFVLLKMLPSTLMKAAAFTMFYHPARAQDTCVKGIEFSNFPISVCR